MKNTYLQCSITSLPAIYIRLSNLFVIFVSSYFDKKWRQVFPYKLTSSLEVFISSCFSAVSTCSLLLCAFSLKICLLFCLLNNMTEVANGQLHNTEKECDWPSTLNDNSDIVVTCRVRNIEQATNYSTPNLEFVRVLNIICEDASYQSRLTNLTFLNFNHIQSLRIDNCNIPTFPDYVFFGLSNLRNLTIALNRTNVHPLSFGPEAFAELQELELLHLAQNNIVVMPNYLFCDMSNLRTLNLTDNELDDARSLGLGSEENTACLPELVFLDLSYNILKSIPDEVFSTLHVLKTLFLNNNQLSELYPYAFSGLNKLQSLDLSNNRISHIPEQIFQQSSDILELYLQNNSLTSLTPGVFHGLRQLVVLNLSYNSLDSVVSADTLGDLSRLAVLDLNHNRFQVVNGTYFHSLNSLQILYLSYNNIHSISDNSFASLHNLHTLTLAGNKMKYIDASTLTGLGSLNYISLNNNEIEDIHPEAFKGCSSVQNLKLRTNKLSSFPKATNSLHLLKHLDLTHNKIHNITNATFAGLRNVVSLHLSRNRVGNMTRGCFQDLSSLKTLDLSHNKVQSLGHGLFDDVPELRVVKFNDNHLVDINGLFMNLRFLHTLNVSRNRITWFDYALVPTELKILDIHDNEIDGLGNYFELESLMQLRILDASHNIVRELGASSLPNSIEIASFHSNKLSVIGPFTFMAKTNLSFVDLRNNFIRHLDINALRLKSIPKSRHLPSFVLSNNTLFCDCSMEWLQRINNLDETRQYPRIDDLDNVLCYMTFPRQHAVIPISQARSADFLCKYHSHCFALCHCCEFDACDCEMVCPENCTCYSDQTWNTNIVDCSMRGYSHIPHRIPMDVTDLYLDGNDMSHMGSHSFIGRKNMRVLHMNNSNIHIIRNRTFNGLQNLLVLHLQHNHISVIQGHEFTNLTKLQELYLSHNRIIAVNNSSFKHLKFLQILHLDHNHLVEFQVWNLNYNPRLVRVKLGHNKWSCRCAFIEPFRIWFITHRAIIMDSGRIRCVFSNSTSLFLVELTNSTCSNFSVVPFKSAEFVEEYMPVMIIVPMILLVIFLSFIIICKHRNEMKMWVYSKYGVRLFEKNAYSNDAEKLFDAFLSYCKKDEAFVAQMMAPELECGNPPYRLCLRYRDLPMSGYVAEAISEAIECSHCTVAVISEQYLKSEWCLFELKAAHHESQCNRRHKVIVVLLDKVNFKELDPDIRQCLRSAVVIHWGDRRFWEKLRFIMPDGRSRKHHVNCTDSKLSSSLRRSSLSNSVKLV